MQQAPFTIGRRQKSAGPVGHRALEEEIFRRRSLNGKNLKAPGVYKEAATIRGADKRKASRRIDGDCPRRGGILCSHSVRGGQLDLLEDGSCLRCDDADSTRAATGDHDSEVGSVRTSAPRGDRNYDFAERCPEPDLLMAIDRRVSAGASGWRLRDRALANGIRRPTGGTRTDSSSECHAEQCAPGDVRGGVRIGHSAPKLLMIPPAAFLSRSAASGGDCAGAEPAPTEGTE